MKGSTTIHWKYMNFSTFIFSFAYVMPICKNQDEINIHVTLLRHVHKVLCTSQLIIYCILQYSFGCKCKWSTLWSQCKLHHNRFWVCTKHISNKSFLQPLRIFLQLVGNEMFEFYLKALSTVSLSLDCLISTL